MSRALGIFFFNPLGRRQQPPSWAWGGFPPQRRPPEAMAQGRAPCQSHVDKRLWAVMLQICMFSVRRRAATCGGLQLTACSVHRPQPWLQARGGGIFSRHGRSAENGAGLMPGLPLACRWLGVGRRRPPAGSMPGIMPWARDRRRSALTGPLPLGAAHALVIGQRPRQRPTHTGQTPRPHCEP